MTTTGTGASHGIFASSPTGAISIVADDISTAGAGAFGVTTTGTGAVSITTGDITTTGNGSTAVVLDRNTTSATVLNLGMVSTSGTNAGGVHLFNGFNSSTGGAITVTAQSITTTGNTVPTGTPPNQHYIVGAASHGIEVLTEGSGANGRVVIDTSVGATPGTLGSVNVSGYKASGIVVSSGTIGSGVPGNPNILVGGGQIDITVGTVNVAGDFGAGITAETTGLGADVNIPRWAPSPLRAQSVQRHRHRGSKATRRPTAFTAGRWAGATSPSSPRT